MTTSASVTLLIAITVGVHSFGRAENQLPRPMRIYFLEIKTDIKGESHSVAADITQSLEEAFTKLYPSFRVLDKRNIGERAAQIADVLQNSKKPANVQPPAESEPYAYMRGELLAREDGVELRLSLQKFDSEILWSGHTIRVLNDWKNGEKRQRDASDLAGEAEARLFPAAAEARPGAPSPQELFEKAQAYYRWNEQATDYRQAFILYSQSASAGDRRAMFMAGWMSEHSFGTPKDLQKAFDWYLKAADGGEPRALYRLAEMYYKGDGPPAVRINCEQSHQYFQKAIIAGNLEALLAFAKHNDEGSGPVHDWCFNSGTDAFEAYTKLALGGNVKAMRRAAQLSRTFEEKSKWYREAIQRGDATSAYQLGICFYDGLETKADFAQARELITAAVGKNVDDSYEALHWMPSALFFQAAIQDPEVSGRGAKIRQWNGRITAGKPYFLRADQIQVSDLGVRFFRESGAMFAYVGQTDPGDYYTVRVDAPKYDHVTCKYLRVASKLNEKDTVEFTLQPPDEPDPKKLVSVALRLRSGTPAEFKDSFARACPTVSWK